MAGTEPARPTVPSLAGQLFGRARELAEIESVLDDLISLPRAIALVGEAGIGKTTLWAAAIGAAGQRGYRCLTARPAEPEADLAFTSLGDLLGAEYPAIADQLPDPQRRAIAAALLVDDDVSRPAEPRAIALAVLTTLRILAAERPLLLAIDDLQWVDDASAKALGFALRRLAGASVALVTARRVSSVSDAAAPPIETRLPTATIIVGALSLGALHAIVVDRLGHSLSRRHLRRLHELSRGNPFLAAELLRVITDPAGSLSLDDPSIGEPDLERLLGTRLDVLPITSRGLLLLVSAASRPTLDLLESAVGPEVAERLAPALRSGIVELIGREVRFSHPLLASSAYAASEHERRTAHAVLAEHVDDAVERARHLGLATIDPDEGVAADVESAAQTVFRRGAPAVAAQLLAIATRLTPADALLHRTRRAELHAQYLFAAGDTAAAADMLEGLLAASPQGLHRPRLLALLARIHHFMDDLDRGIQLNLEALDGLRGDDELRASIHEGLAWGLMLTRRDLPGAALHASRATRAARASGDRAVLAEALAARAITALAIGQPHSRALREAMRLEPATLELRVLRHPSYALLYVLVATDQLAAARVTAAELVTRAEAQGDDSALPSICVQLSMAELLAGAWQAAEDQARVGIDIAEQAGQQPSRAALTGRLALLAAWRGQLGTALELGSRALLDAGAPDHSAASIRRVPLRGGELGTWALGAVALAGGHHEQALDYLQPLGDELLGAGLREPGELRFLPDLVEAQLGAGQTDAAAEIVAEMEAMAAKVRRSTASGIAARCRALVELQRNAPDAAIVPAEAAVALLRGGALPLDEGRALFVLGTCQQRNRQRSAARESLAAATAAFDRLGAEGWAVHARAELARLGGRPTADGRLTPTEQRVAALVADGLANKEVAATLGISVKTVELHLSHVYAKLEVGSRTELVKQLTLGKT